MSAIDFEKMRAQMRADAAAKRAASKAAASPAAAADAAARVDMERWPPSPPLTAAQRVGELARVHYLADWISAAAAEALMQQVCPTNTYSLATHLIS